MPGHASLGIPASVHPSSGFFLGAISVRSMTHPIDPRLRVAFPARLTSHRPITAASVRPINRPDARSTARVRPAGRNVSAPPCLREAFSTLSTRVDARTSRSGRRGVSPPYTRDAPQSPPFGRKKQTRTIMATKLSLCPVHPPARRPQRALTVPAPVRVVPEWDEKIAWRVFTVPAQQPLAPLLFARRSAHPKGASGCRRIRPAARWRGTHS